MRRGLPRMGPGWMQPNGEQARRARCAPVYVCARYVCALRARGRSCSVRGGVELFFDFILWNESSTYLCSVQHKNTTNKMAFIASLPAPVLAAIAAGLLAFACFATSVAQAGLDNVSK